MSALFPTDFPLRVNAGGSAEFVNRGMDGTPAAILVGLTGSRVGLVIGLPCRLEADESSPWRLLALGDIDRKPTRWVTKKCADQDWVHLLPVGDDLECLRQAAALYGKHVRIVYESGGGR